MWFSGTGRVALWVRCPNSLLINYGILQPTTRSTTILTDGNDVVIRMLQKTVKLTTQNATVHSLLWGDTTSIGAVLDQVPEIEIIVGADVVCWPHLVLPLLNTVKVHDESQGRLCGGH